MRAKINTSLIPRTAGTSLAGQVVGKGIVVDVSKNFTKILEFNKEEAWVRVQPGVIRDELNLFLKPHGSAIRTGNIYSQPRHDRRNGWK